LALPLKLLFLNTRFLELF